MKRSDVKRLKANLIKTNYSNWVTKGLVARVASASVFMSASLLSTMVDAQEQIPVKPGIAKTFITLPPGLTHPEGITHNPTTGEFYIGTFNVPNAEFNPNPVNALLRYSAEGELLARTDFSGPTPMVGLEYSEHDDKVYITSLGDISGVGSKILRIEANFADEATAEFVADVPMIGSPLPINVPNLDGSLDNVSFSNFMRVPNDFEITDSGDLYFSDSFQGAIFKIDDIASCDPCIPNLVIHNGLLATAGTPSFGANGIALNADETSLFIANTGDDRILKLDLVGDQGLSIFAQNINGPDGIKFGPDGTLWVAANQADKIIGVNSQGRVIAKLGDYRGIRRNGSPRGLLFPGSLTIKDKTIYVTNLSIAATPQPGDESEELVTKYSVSKIDLSKLAP